MVDASRREMLGGCGAGLLVRSPGERSRIFVLIHGAWHGGWCWREVARRLVQAGHRVFTPTLSGLGERSHLAGPAVGLETHILDVLGVLEAEELTSVTLVGHSYAGMVVTGCADRAPRRIERLVYLDAFVPKDGQCVFDFQPAGALERAQEEAQNGWAMLPPKVEVLGLEPSSAPGRWVARRMTPQPIETWRDRIRLTGPAEHPVRQYIHCTSPNLYGLFNPFAERARREPGWLATDLPAGHDAMISAPGLLTRALLL